MSGIGHLAAGLAAKPLAPKVPLVVLLAASETTDLLYFVFTTLGVERPARTTFDWQQGMRYLEPIVNPWSHGLLMSVVWSLLAAGLAYLVYRDRRSAGVIGAVVFSHWLLDLLMHANLPLFFEGSALLGLGLERSGLGMVVMTALDLVLLAAGLIVYWRWRRRGKAADGALALGSGRSSL